MATGFEVMASRGGSLSELRRRFMVEDADDEQDVLDWATANTPTALEGLARSGFSMQENDELVGVYDVEVTYGSTRLPPTVVDQVDYRFNFQATGAHVFQSLSTISATQDGGGTAPDFGGAINVVNDSGGQRVEGLELPIPTETFTLTYTPANATIDSSYQLLVESLCGKVNSATFKGRPAGSLMLVRCAGGAKNLSNWSIEFGFGYIANATSIPVGGITVAAKDGLDLLWAYYESDTDATAKSLIRKPRAAYVERVFYRADLNTLGI